MNLITLLITDDHKTLREAWKMVLNADPDFLVLRTCANGEEAVEAAERLRPQLVIMDINLPDMSGIEATEIILNRVPETKVLGYSLHYEPSYALRFLTAGAKGYLAKTSSVEEMKAALRQIKTTGGCLSMVGQTGTAFLPGVQETKH